MYFTKARNGNIPFGTLTNDVAHRVCTYVHDVGSEPLIQPQVRPPLHRDKVTKPLMRQLVRDCGKRSLLVQLRADDRIEQQERFSEV